MGGDDRVPDDEDEVHEPKTPPKVTYTGTNLTIQQQAGYNINVDDDGIGWILNTHYRGSLDVQIVTMAIRIDGIDFPPVGVDGKNNWYKRNSTNFIRSHRLPEHALQPGQHTIELDMRQVVAPVSLSQFVAPEKWPTNLVATEATHQTTFTVPENAPEP